MAFGRGPRVVLHFLFRYNLIRSGENIDIEMVKNGRAELFEAAQAQSWILSENGYE
jgi:hypothetical protein